MDCCDFLAYQERVYNKQLSHRREFYAIFMITDDCNFRCTYCFENNKHSCHMSLNTAKKFIDAMFDFSNHKDFWKNYYIEGDNYDFIRISFFGGEPFLNPSLMLDIIEYYKSKCKEDWSKYEKRWHNTYFNITTNGSLIRSKKAIELLDKYIDKINLMITYEGVKEYHDACRKFKDTGLPTFDIIDKNVKWYMKKYNKSPNSKITITPDNISYMFKCYQHMKELGEKRIYMKIVKDDERWTTGEYDSIADEQYKLIMQDLLDNPDISYTTFEPFYGGRSIDEVYYPGCGVGRNNITIEADGRLFPCYQFSEISQDEDTAKEYCIGNVDIGISEHGCELLKTLWKWGGKNKYTTDKCQTCTFPHHCTDCVANNVKYNKNPNISIDWDCRISMIEHKYALIYNYIKESKRNEEANIN